MTLAENIHKKIVNWRVVSVQISTKAGGYVTVPLRVIMFLMWVVSGYELLG